MFYLTTLKNGLGVITAQMEEARSICTSDLMQAQHFRSEGLVIGFGP